ncbi:MAG: hypothetical protein WC869_00595 [Phycisphaerae bacterium]|jgi:hypothetical protein
MTDPVDPNLAERNAALAELTAKLAHLDAQIEALGEAAQDKRRKLREEYRAAHEKRFSDVDYKRALVGAKNEHAVTVKGVVSFFIRAPNAATTHAVDKFIAEPVLQDETDKTKGTPMGPVTEAERMLMAWVVAVHLLADPSAKRQDIEQLSPGHRLRMVRGLPESLIQRVAEECSLLQSWLNVVLEIELGNF